MSLEQFSANIYVGTTDNNNGYYWSVSVGDASHKTIAGTESTRLKAWRKACRVAKEDFGPVHQPVTQDQHKRSII